MTRDQSDDKVVLAGEYVVGTLDWEDRLAVEARLAGDAELRGHVAFWQMHLAGLMPGVEPVRAPWVLDRINASLFGRAVAPRGFAALFDRRGLGLVLLVTGLVLALMIKVLSIAHLLN